MATKAQHSPRPKRSGRTKATKAKPARKTAPRATKSKSAATTPARTTKAAASVVASVVPAEYISNPFALIRPSLRALRLNWPWVLLVAIGGLVVTLACLAGVVTTVVLALYVHSLRAVLLSILVTAALAALIVAFVIPLVVIVLLDSAKGRKLPFRQTLGRCWHYSGRIFIAAVLASLATLGGLILLVVPGIIFAAWYSLAAFVIVDEDTSAMEGLRRSRQLVRGHLVEMLGLYGLGEFLNFVPLIGSFVSFIFSLASLASPAVRYLQLKELEAGASERAVTGEVSLPSPHWANWLVIILSAISLIFGAAHGVQNAGQLQNPSLNPGDNTGIGY